MNALVSLSQAQSLAATKADSDQTLLASWLDSLGSPHTRRAYNATGSRFLAILACPLRSATVEDVRDALNIINAGRSAATSRQHTLRVKSLLSYAHKLGYTLFNAGAAIKPPKEARGLAKRILAELDVRDLIRGAGGSRNYLLLAIFYGTGVRVSELVGLNVGDVIDQGNGRVQLHVVGKGGKEREVLLPQTLGSIILAARQGRPSDAPLFLSHSRRHGPKRLSARAVNHVIKKVAAKFNVTPKVSAHWFRHAHASHSLDRGAPLSVVAATLGHDNISTASAYLHAKPGAASGDALDAEVWKLTPES
jgi:integrase/recombinase XerD